MIEPTFYRFLSRNDDKCINDILQQNIRSWANEFALFPVTIEIKQGSGFDKKNIIVKNKKNGFFLACCHPDYQLFFQHLNFATACCCFEEVCLTLAEKFFSTILQQEVQISAEEHPMAKQWDYIGSPYYTVHLYTPHQSFCFSLHPHWVVMQLPKNRQPLNLSPLSSALGTQTLPLTLLLHPARLNFAELCDLKVGDVIKTEHPLAQELALCFAEKTLCYATIGRNAEQRTVQLQGA